MSRLLALFCDIFGHRWITDWPNQNWAHCLRCGEKRWAGITRW